MNETETPATTRRDNDLPVIVFLATLVVIGLCFPVTRDAVGSTFVSAWDFLVGVATALLAPVDAVLTAIFGR